MNLALLLLSAVLAASAVWLLLSRSLVRLVLGVALLGHAANLMVFLSGRPDRTGLPLVPEDAVAPLPGHADPLPHALVLTAIVIGFGATAFLAVLARRLEGPGGSDDLDAHRSAEL